MSTIFTVTQELSVPDGLLRFYKWIISERQAVNLYQYIMLRGYWFIRG